MKTSRGNTLALFGDRENLVTVGDFNQEDMKNPWGNTLARFI